MKLERANYRVMKTLLPQDRGALQWARHYGPALVCVRHRTDAKGKVRHTTVELLVESVPIRPRSFKMVYVSVASNEQTLRQIVQTAGGRWDAKHRLWRLPSRVAGILSLRDRIVEVPAK